MTPERHQQIGKLYHASLEQTPTERAAFLDTACAGDLVLRQEVEALLALDQKAEGYLESPALAVAAGMLAEESAVLPVGHIISTYKILSPLGAGGMGQVYLAEDFRLGRQVALKLLPTQFTQDADRVRRFKQEARTIAALNHPNIITIYEVGEVAGTHYIATEFIDGQTLRQRTTHEPMKLRDAVEVAVQVASALVAAHNSGVIHRDIKPENIMLRKDGLVKVLDFGLAKLTDAQAVDVGSGAVTNEAVRTGAGFVMGTVRYMSPEQLRGVKLDARSDIFSMGVVLHEMIVGKSPFPGATTADAIAAILNQEPPPITRYVPEAPEAMERILTLSLCKERTRRYQTAQEMLEDLKRLKQRLEIDIEPKDDAAGAAESEAAQTASGFAAPRNKKVALLKVTAAVATIALVLFIAWRSLPDRNAAPATDAPITSLAIRPLENMSHDPEQEFFADGMTEALITQLGNIGTLRVPGRTSVMAYKGTTKSLTEFAAELRVDAVIEGSVLSSGGKVRISVKLIRPGREERILWAQQYDGDAPDVLTLQNVVARDIAREIKIQLSPREQQRLARVQPVDPEAYKNYLLGRFFWSKANADGYLKAIDYFETARSIAQDYAAPYAGLADTYVEMGFGGLLLPKEAYEAGRDQALQALRLDPELAEAHVSLAGVLNDYDWNWAEAESHYRRALALNPSYSIGHTWYAAHLSDRSRFPEAIAEAQTALNLDPGSLEVNLTVGDTYYFARDYPRAIQSYERVIELDPKFPPAYEDLAKVYEMLEMPDKAFEAYQKYLMTAEVATSEVDAFAKAYRSGGMPSYLQKMLGREEEDEKEGNGVWPLRRASFYARLGDKERAFQWIEKAFDKRSPHLQYLAVEPVYDSLHGDPRFRKFLERLHLTPVPARN